MGALTHWIINTFASPLGIIVLTALDATVFVSLPFGIDVAVIIVAARSESLTWIVPWRDRPRVACARAAAVPFHRIRAGGRRA